MNPTPSSPSRPAVQAREIATVLVANRGEIARRVIRTVHALGLKAVAVYSDADAQSAHVREADVAVRLGPAPAAESYLNQQAVIEAAVATCADAVHPGYGFLSENAEFGKALEAAGVAFIGPNELALDVMADKITAKNHVAAAGVPVTPGVAEAGLDDAALIARADGVGYPLLIKPSAGGGGQGMVEVHTASELPAALASARRTARTAFGDDTLFLERLVTTPRHIEVQILADQHGNVVHLGERECSLQRRHQKVIEEAPAPLLEMLDAAGPGSESGAAGAGGVDAEALAASGPGADGSGSGRGSALRERLGRAAVDAARSVNYRGAGTVEFLVSDERPDEFFFMEMNTRLQVEHPVTEEVVRVRGERLDLVGWQIRIASGEALDFTQDEVSLVGHAVEARVYAERPAENFLPAVGPVRHVEFPAGPGVRVDAALDGPGEVSAYYDPMIAKVIAWGADRTESLRRLDRALAQTFVAGAGTNVDYLRTLLADEEVRAGRLDTGLIARKSELTRPVVNEDAAALASLAAAVLETRAGAGRDALDPLVPSDGEGPPSGGNSAGISAGASNGTTAGTAGHPGAAALEPGPAASGTMAGTTAGAGWQADGFRAGGTNASVAIRLVGEDGEALDAAITLTGRGASGEAGELLVSGGPATRHREATAQRVRYEVGGRSAEATVVHTAGPTAQLWVHTGGTTLHVSAPLRAQRTREALANREREQAGASPLALAPMTGTVSTVLVSTGDSVSAGTPLLAIEAMKMEHPVIAPLDGVVTVNVSVGEQVAQGKAVAVVDPAAGEPQEDPTPEPAHTPADGQKEIS